MFRSAFRALAAAALVTLAAPPATAAEPRLEARTGVMVTPRNFPNHSPQDVADMFRLAAEAGSFAVIRVNWNDPNRVDAARAMIALARQQGLEPALELTAIKADEIKGATIDPPKGIDDGGRRVSFGNPRVADQFSRDVLELAQLRPAYFAVGTDVNLLDLTDPGDHAAFAQLVRQLVPRIRQAAPDTKVYVSFQWEALHRSPGARALVDRYRPLDLLAFNSEPRRLYEDQGPGGIPPDYYARMREFRAGREPLLVEVSWASDGRSGEAEQVRFIRDLPRLLGPARPTMVSWTFLHDVKVLVLFTARAGLLQADGNAKPSFSAFKSLSTDRPSGAAVAAATTAAPAGALGVAPRSAVTTASRQPAHFAVYTARLDGSDLRILLSSEDREMSHPRVSPDGTRVVITRYNRRGRDGKATEEQGYEDTEILVMNLDGTGLETVIPMKPGIIAANGCWTPDGKSLIWLSTDNASRSPEIRQIDLATRRITRVPTPPGLKTTDPHWEAGKMVFPVKATGGGADALWVMNENGDNARQVTFPKRTGILPGLYGDFDPKLSPDGTKIAFMRIDGGDSWRVMTLDLRTKEERLLTPKGVIEWLPTWSSDGKRLLYVHIDRSRPKEIGLYTMTPDGNDRRMVPLPRGYLYGHSSWFPGDGSSDRARIIFTGVVKPGL